MKAIETERLIIRPTNIEDASFIYELLNSPKWIKFVGDRNIQSVKDAADYIKQKMLPQLERLGFSNNTIIRKKDNIKMGTCGLFDRDGIDGVDIGFSFLPNYEKQGYAFESSDMLIKVSKKQFKIKKVNAITTKDNISSQKLIKKLGLKYNKIVKVPNDDTEYLLFVMEL